MDQAQPVGRIDVISDAICPWCYIGKRQLERALDILAKQALRRHRRLASLPAQSRDAGRRRRRATIPHRQVRQPRALAAARPAHHRDRGHRRPRIPSRQAHAHAQHRERPSPDPLGRPEGRAGRRRRGAVRGLFLQRRRHRRRKVLADDRPRGRPRLRRGAGHAGGRRGRKEVLAGDQMARNAGIQGVPSFALQGHVLFSGAVPAEEMAQTFHPRLGTPEEPRAPDEPPARRRNSDVRRAGLGPSSWLGDDERPLHFHDEIRRACRCRCRCRSSVSVVAAVRLVRLAMRRRRVLALHRLVLQGQRAAAIEAGP